MDYKDLNKILKNLQYPDNKVLEFVEQKWLKQIDSEGQQGEEGSFYKIYKLKSDPGTFLKINFYTDSYGYGEYIRGVEFVKPIQKTITDYTAI